MANMAQAAHRTAAAAFGALLVVLLLCTGAADATCTGRRVRKEIRRLTTREYQLYLSGLSTMLSVDMEAGVKVYGPMYRSYEYFIMKHAIVTQTPINGVPYDIGHFGQQFGPFHLAFLKEFEDSLCAIVPDLPGAPYWSLHEDCLGTDECPGEYYGSDLHIDRDIYMGTLNGNPDNGWQTDTAFFGGILAGANIKAFSFNKWPDLSQYFNGSETGLMRDPSNVQTEPWAIRYPYQNLAAIPSRAVMALGWEMPYNKLDFLRCTDPTLVRTAVDWGLCIDAFTAVAQRLTDDPYIMETFSNHISAITHISFHNIYGSFLAGTEDDFPPFGYLGDSRVVNTSPNEYLGFFLHHNSVVRNFQMWMAESLKFNATNDNPNVMWSFPTQVDLDGAPRILPGTTLDDVISPIMPFTDILGYSVPRGVTFRDIMSFNWNKLYTYDDMDANARCRPMMQGVGRRRAAARK